MPSKHAEINWIELTHLTRTDEQQRKWRRGPYTVRGDSWANQVPPYPTRQELKNCAWGGGYPKNILHSIAKYNAKFTVKRSRVKISASSLNTQGQIAYKSRSE